MLAETNQAPCCICTTQASSRSQRESVLYSLAVRTQRRPILEILVRGFRSWRSGTSGLSDGCIVTEVKFESGDEKLKALETATFVSAGRFRYEHGHPVVVEYKVSQVVKGN